MLTYFKPLRRKIGVLTLMVAYVFVAGWARSFYAFESLTSHWSPMKGMAISNDGVMTLRVRTRHSEGEKALRFVPARMFEWVSDPHERRDMRSDFPNWKLAWNWVLFGISLESYLEQEERIMIDIKMSYWSLVIPLTFLSAWLLLSKPRVKKMIDQTPVP